MQLNAITSLTFPQDTSVLSRDQNTESFGTILNAAIRLLDETSRTEHEATAWQLDFASGVTDDFLAVVLAERRAASAVTFTTQMASSIMDSYRQIMQLQI